MGGTSVTALPLAEVAGSAYGLVVSGPGMVIYVDADFDVRVGMEPVAIKVEVGPNVRMKVASTKSGTLGDVNNNGQVDIDDGLLVAMYSVNSSTSMPNNGDISLGDVNCNGLVDFTDARLIVTYILNPSDSAVQSLSIGQSGGCSSDRDVKRPFDPSTVEAIDLEEDLSGSHTGELSAANNADDYYRFTLDDTRTMSLSVDDLTADANLTLYDELGIEIERSEQPGKVDETINRTLWDGTYYVRIQAIQTRGTIGYKLNYSADSSYDGSYTQLGNLTNATVVEMWSGDVHYSNNRDDYYYFTLNDIRTLNIRLGSLTANADLWLEPSSGSTIERSEQPGKDEESIVHTLPAGTYRIRVRAPADVVAGYQLSYQTQTNSGQSRSEPIELGNLVKGTRSGSWLGDVHSTDNVDDYYRFTLDDTRTISLRVNELTADVDLTLYDESGVEIERSELPGKVDESIQRTLWDGTYYVRIQAIHTRGTIGYKFNYSADSSYDGSYTYLGNLTNATVVEIWSGDVHYSNNRDDYYDFTLNGTRTVTIRLGRLTTDANLYLRKSSGGGDIASSENADTEEDLIVHTLSPGAYRIHVRATAEVITGYQLSYSVAEEE